MRKYFLILLLTSYHGYCQEFDFAVRLKLKPQINRSYLATEDAEIKALLSKHDIALRQTCPGAKKSELLLYYTLRGKGNKANFIKEYLATGKFENDIYEHETVYITSCVNPVSVNDPHFLDANRWSLDLINAPCAWAITKGNPNVLIGIADTEFETTHEDLRNKYVSINGVISPTPNHHGTSVASIAAAETNNSLGMASVGYNSRIAAHRIYHSTSSGSASSADIFDAIWSLYQMGVPIINVSWTGTGLTSPFAQEITQNGTTLVLSGGNTPTSTQHGSIADIPGVIVVSSVDKNNMHGTTGHAHNQWVDICAPGTGVYIARPNNSYSIGYGTSFAAPFVSGTIALMLSVNPTLTPAKIEEVLKTTTSSIADAHLYPNQLGAGLLNAYAAVNAVVPKISGSTSLCSNSTATFTVSNAPAGYTWGCSSNLTPVAGSPGSFSTPATNASAWVSINYNGMELARKSITVKRFISISGPYVLGANQMGAYQASPPCSRHNAFPIIKWYLQHPNMSREYLGEGANMVSLKTFKGSGISPRYVQGSPEYKLWAELHSSSGMLSEASATVAIPAGYSLMAIVFVAESAVVPMRVASEENFVIQPNPASTTLHVESDNTSTQQARTLSQSSTATYRAQLISTITGTVVLNQTVSGESFDLDVSGVLNGNYTLVLSQNGSKEWSAHVIVQH